MVVGAAVVVAAVVAGTEADVVGVGVSEVCVGVGAEEASVVEDAGGSPPEHADRTSTSAAIDRAGPFPTVTSGPLRAKLPQ